MINVWWGLINGKLHPRLEHKVPWESVEEGQGLTAWIIPDRTLVYGNVVMVLVVNNDEGPGLVG